MAFNIYTRRGEMQQSVTDPGEGFVGVMGMWPVGATAPAGFLPCDGTSFSAVTFPVLASFLGTTSTPDMRERLAVGVGAHADISTIGDTDGLPLATRAPVHYHLAGVTSHGHSASHQHSAATHLHGTVDTHKHGSPEHTHSTPNHSGHTVVGLSGNPLQTASADGVPSGSGTDTRNSAHNHSVGTLDTDPNTAGTATGYHSGVNGGFTSTDAPGNTGNSAPVPHVSGGETTSNTVGGIASQAAIPHLAVEWIIRAR